VRAEHVHPRSLRSDLVLHRLDLVPYRSVMRPFSLSFEATDEATGEGLA
jgi:hypothetical protein